MKSNMHWQRVQVAPFNGDGRIHLTEDTMRPYNYIVFCAGLIRHPFLARAIEHVFTGDNFLTIFEILLLMSVLFAEAPAYSSFMPASSKDEKRQ